MSADGARLRAAFREGGGRGTVLFLQGRTDTTEKYVGVAAELGARGFSVLAVDWRGQGGSERLADDPLLGHVDDFAEYQLDLDALLAAAPERPVLALAHSMGGGILLRRLLAEPDLVRGAVFSAPMWGLFGLMDRLLTPVARLGATWCGAREYAIFNQAKPYALGSFDVNVLTSDPESYAAFARLARERPELALGGVSWGWIRAALLECLALRSGRLETPAAVLLGSREVVVSPRAIRARTRRDGARLVEIAGARHEPFFEVPPARARVWRAFDDFVEELGL